MNTLIPFDPNWILSYRYDSLTIFFKIFPFFASDTFYIIWIATGYWGARDKRIFKHLAFLVTFSTLINCTLKNIFSILRPDNFLHLISVLDPYGFPSGDVQVATVFWLSLFFASKNKTICFLYFLPILGIFLSRVYLGVHSLYDVVGGLIIGAFSFYMWNHFTICKKFFSPQGRVELLFWISLLAIMGLYSLISLNMKWPPMVPLSLGALIGLGLSLNKNYKESFINLSYFKSYLMILLGLLIIGIEDQILPISKNTTLVFNSCLVIKYCIIVYSVFNIIPSIFIKINKKFVNNK